MVGRYSDRVYKCYTTDLDVEKALKDLHVQGEKQMNDRKTARTRQ